MLEVERPSDLAVHAGAEIGVSAWLVIDQAMIDAFAEATGDRQWIHVDRERAGREIGGTIAHGWLLVSLIPRLAAGLLTVRRRSRSLNYGANRIRFTAPVPSGAAVRLRQRLEAVETMPGGARLTLASTLELRDAQRPALVAETLSLILE